MAEVWFYHLTRSPLEAALPLILEKVLARGLRAAVLAPDKDLLDALDRHLWVWRSDSFLPHGVVGGPHDTSQPVLLATPGAGAPAGPHAEQPARPADFSNTPDMLMLVGGALPDPATAGDWQRVCLFFDGGDEQAMQAARAAWRGCIGAGLAAQYWAQADDGPWQRKAHSAATSPAPSA